MIACALACALALVLLSTTFMIGLAAGEGKNLSLIFTSVQNEESAERIYSDKEMAALTGICILMDFTLDKDSGIESSLMAQNELYIGKKGEVIYIAGYDNVGTDYVVMFTYDTDADTVTYEVKYTAEDAEVATITEMMEASADEYYMIDRNTIESVAKMFGQ